MAATPSAVIEFGRFKVLPHHRELLADGHRRGLHGDPDMAVLWYRHARDLGATGVASRLKKLEAKEGRN